MEIPFWKKNVPLYVLLSALLMVGTLGTALAQVVATHTYQTIGGRSYVITRYATVEAIDLYFDGGYYAFNVTIFWSSDVAVGKYTIMPVISGWIFTPSATNATDVVISGASWVHDIDSGDLGERFWYTFISNKTELPSAFSITIYVESS